MTIIHHIFTIHICKNIFVLLNIYFNFLTDSFTGKITIFYLLISPKTLEATTTILPWLQPHKKCRSHWNSSQVQCKEHSFV